MELTNWKLKKIENQIEIVAEDSAEYLNEILTSLELPQPDTLTGMNRAETCIDWKEMPEYHKFFFDLEGWEPRIQQYFKKSLAQINKLIIIYGWKEPTIKVSTDLFIEDWEGFFQSTKYETIIFSEDFKFIMEVSRDYYLHSNFIIKTD